MAQVLKLWTAAAAAALALLLVIVQAAAEGAGGTVSMPQSATLFSRSTSKHSRGSTSSSSGYITDAPLLRKLLEMQEQLAFQQHSTEHGRAAIELNAQQEDVSSSYHARSLELDETLEWLHIWFETMLPALELSRGPWTELRHSCATQSIALARQLYQRTLDMTGYTPTGPIGEGAHEGSSGGAAAKASGGSKGPDPKAGDAKAQQRREQQQQQQPSSHEAQQRREQQQQQQPSDEKTQQKGQQQERGPSNHRRQQPGSANTQQQQEQGPSSHTRQLQFQHGKIRVLQEDKGSAGNTGAPSATGDGSAGQPLAELLSHLLQHIADCHTGVCALVPTNISPTPAPSNASAPATADGSAKSNDTAASDGDSATEEPYQGAFPITRRIVLSALHALNLALQQAADRGQAGSPADHADGGHGKQSQVPEGSKTGKAQQLLGIPQEQAAPSHAPRLRGLVQKSDTSHHKVTLSGPTILDRSSMSRSLAEKVTASSHSSSSNPSSSSSALQADLEHVQLAGRTAVLTFAHTELCSHALRPIMEGLHVSKSGGTSMCELARLAGKSSPGFNPYANCKLKEFGLAPRWGRHERFPDFVPHECQNHSKFWVVPKSRCDTWIKAEQKWTCKSRLEKIKEKKMNWYMNEVALYGSEPGDPFSSHLCTNQVVTLMMLRDPVERVTSHISHLKGLYETTTHSLCEEHLDRKLPPWELLANLTFLSWLAPQLLDNAALRYLLGRHTHCKDYDLAQGSALNKDDLAAGLARIVALDYVLVLGDDVANLTDVVMRLGMGWPMTLLDVAFRKQSKPHDLEADMGFPAGSDQTIQNLNRWDRQLTEAGRVILTLDAAYYATASAIMAVTLDHSHHDSSIWNSTTVTGSSNSTQLHGTDQLSQPHATGYDVHDKHEGDHSSESEDHTSQPPTECELLLASEVPLVRRHHTKALKRSLLGSNMNFPPPSPLEQVVEQACKRGGKNSLSKGEQSIMANTYTGARSEQGHAIGMPRALIEHLLMFGVDVGGTASLPKLGLYHHLHHYRSHMHNSSLHQR